MQRSTSHRSSASSPAAPRRALAPAFVPIGLLAPLAPCAAQEAALHHLFTLPGQSPGERCGAALAVLGDVDGDGLADFAVGAPAAPLTLPDGSSQPAGRVRWHSGASGLVLRETAASAPYERFGAALCALGDLDGDGLPELAIGAPLAQQGRGRVEVRRGADGALLWSQLGAAPGEQLAAALAAVADSDGDGRSELLAGAPGAKAGGLLAGAALLLRGADGAALWRREGQAGDRFGAAVLGGLWIEPGGAPALAIGAPLSDAAAFNAGAVWLCRASDGLPLRTVLGAAVGEMLGSALWACPERDGDGLPELLALAPGADAGGLDSGAARLFGSASGALLLELAGPSAGVFAASAVPVDDLDGDGLGDFCLGASGHGPGERGQVRLLSGSDGSPLGEFVGDGDWDWFGAALEPLPDLTGDGLGELLIGAPGHDDHQPPGFARVLSLRALDLSADQHQLGAGAGGAVRFRIAPEPPLPGAPYLLLAGGAGPAPAGQLLPFALDAWTLWLLTAPNQPPWSGTLGLLDGLGRAEARLDLGPGQAPLLGLSLSHAALWFPPAEPPRATRAAPVAILP